MTFIYKSIKLLNSQILFELNYKRCLVINEFVFLSINSKLKFLNE